MINLPIERDKRLIKSILEIGRRKKGRERREKAVKGYRKADGGLLIKTQAPLGIRNFGEGYCWAWRFSRPDYHRKQETRRKKGSVTSPPLNLLARVMKNANTGDLVSKRGTRFCQTKSDKTYPGILLSDVVVRTNKSCRAWFGVTRVSCEFRVTRRYTWAKFLWSSCFRFVAYERDDFQLSVWEVATEIWYIHWNRLTLTVLLEKRLSSRATCTAILCHLFSSIELL